MRMDVRLDLWNPQRSRKWNKLHKLGGDSNTISSMSMVWRRIVDFFPIPINELHSACCLINCDAQSMPGLITTYISICDSNIVVLSEELLLVLSFGSSFLVPSVFLTKMMKYTMNIYKVLCISKTFLFIE